MRNGSNSSRTVIMAAVRSDTTIAVSHYEWATVAFVSKEAAAAQVLIQPPSLQFPTAAMHHSVAFHISQPCKCSNLSISLDGQGAWSRAGQLELDLSSWCLWTIMSEFYSSRLTPGTMATDISLSKPPRQCRHFNHSYHP